MIVGCSPCRPIVVLLAESPLWGEKMSEADGGSGLPARNPQNPQGSSDLSVGQAILATAATRDERNVIAVRREPVLNEATGEQSPITIRLVIARLRRRLFLSRRQHHWTTSTLEPRNGEP